MAACLPVGQTRCTHPLAGTGVTSVTGVTGVTNVTNVTGVTNVTSVMGVKIPVEKYSA